MFLRVHLLVFASLANVCWLHFEANPLASLRHERATSRFGKSHKLFYVFRCSATPVNAASLCSYRREHQNSGRTVHARPVWRMGEGELEWGDTPSEAGLDWSVVAAK